MMRDLFIRRGRDVIARTPIWAAAAGLLTAMLAASAAPANAQRQQRKPKVIQLEEIKIEGRVQKPNAFYILNRSNIGYEVMDLRTSFLHKVVMAVQQEPF